MLGPVMVVSWIVVAGISWLVFRTSIPTSLIIGACLSPTDPVLAASVLAKSRFSDRVPKRLKNVSWHWSWNLTVRILISADARSRISLQWRCFLPFSLRRASDLHQINAPCLFQRMDTGHSHLPMHCWAFDRSSTWSYFQPHPPFCFRSRPYWATIFHSLLPTHGTALSWNRKYSWLRWLSSSVRRRYRICSRRLVLSQKRQDTRIICQDYWSDSELNHVYILWFRHSLVYVHG